MTSIPTEMVSARPITACQLCVLGGMDKEESVARNRKRRTCPGSRYEMSLFAISMFILSPACFLTSMVTLSSTIVECDQGNWSLWSKCFFFNQTAPVVSSAEYCKDFVSAPGFVQVARLALIVICLLRVGEILSLYFICYQRSLTAHGVKVIVELMTGVFVLSALWMFETAYPHFLDQELTGCHISSSGWIVLWPFICIPSHYVIMLGWTLHFIRQLLKAYDAAEECPVCNLYLEAVQNHSYDRSVEIPSIVCTNSTPEIFYEE